MAIPADILSIERPKNTFVIRTNKTEPARYAVRSRTGCKYANGRRLPQNGPVIGHIDTEARIFVPLQTEAESNSEKSSQTDVRVSQYETVDLKDWANVVLADRLFKPVLEELKKFYEIHDAIQIYVISLLRVCNKGVKDYELQEAYRTSFVSELYPKVALSKNTVSALFKNMGKACSRIILFMQDRVKNVKANHHLLIDGTLKSNESRINSLSDYSRKALKKRTKDISVMYAFDLELKEPICSKCYPGNMLDLTAYEDFITENNITQGIIIGDKGFPSSSAKSVFKNNKNLHFINPLKRDAKIIKKLCLYEYSGTLSNNEYILYKKDYDQKDSKWLYSFKDLSLSAAEEKDYLHKVHKNHNNFSSEKYEEKRREFGTIVLETNLDLPVETVFSSYNSRWEIELIMRYYKHACDFDETSVHNDYSVISSEFCDFLSSLLTYKLINYFDKCGLFNSMTYKKIMKLLEQAKKVDLPKKGWTLRKISKNLEEMLVKLELLQIQKSSERKRGRPKKNS
ncbi:transposase [Succinimonas amylolytica]|uniref:transposase n=1 Tax=Succinimonas amylolytica TaxID=83769 RepID=UPI00038065DA|nr:transposase [Succinimonas amylolytica]